MDTFTPYPRLPVPEQHLAFPSNSNDNDASDVLDLIAKNEIIGVLENDADGITSNYVWCDPSESDRSLSNIILTEIKHLRLEGLVTLNEINLARDIILEMVGQSDIHTSLLHDYEGRGGEGAERYKFVLACLEERAEYLGLLPQTMPLDRPQLVYPASPAQRSNVPKAKSQPVQTIFGYVNGINIGDSWKGRKQITKVGLHCRPQGSVHGRKEEGVFSLIIAGAYKEDRNHGCDITFTGVGGCDGSNATKKVAQGSKISIEDLTVGPRASNTENCALAKSASTGKPIRVIANLDANLSFCQNAKGFTFIGLWKVSGSFVHRNGKGVNVLRFELSPFDERTRTYVLESIEASPPLGPSEASTGDGGVADDDDDDAIVID